MRRIIGLFSAILTAKFFYAVNVGSIHRIKRGKWQSISINSQIGRDLLGTCSNSEVAARFQPERRS